MKKPQQSVLLWQSSSSVDASNGDRLKKQSDLAVTFDGQRYTYRGLTFTVQEAGVYPSCPLERIQAMVDATLADPARRLEIRRYGRRPWHSIVRPERAASQALDYAFGHNIALVALCIPHVSDLFEEDPARADAWTMEVRSAYACRLRDRDLLLRQLRQAGIPSQFIQSFFR